MLVSLPLIAYVLLVVGFVRLGRDGRGALLDAATVWGVMVLVITEGLSIPGWLSWQGLAAVWSFVDAGLVVAVSRVPVADRHGVKRDVWAAVRRVGWTDLALLSAAALVMAVVGVVALLSPPNTWDAMQYHLPRIVHWIQNRSVAFYPAHDLKQLHMAPGAEYVMLQLHALWGGDRLDNLVQWFAMLGSVIGVTVLARQLGAGSRGQVLAAIVCATIPEGLLAASGAKNDYVLSFWLVALAHYAIRFGKRATGLDAAGVGAALGLACLTKGTAFAFAPPILLTIAAFWPRPAKIAFLKRLPLVIALVIGLTAAHFARNASFFGSPFGPAAEDAGGLLKYRNDVISIPIILSNALRSLVVHGVSEDRARNAMIEDRVGRILHTFGADPNDPRTNFFSTMPFQLPGAQIHEGFAGNRAHVVLALVTLLILLARARRPDVRAAAVYSLGLLLSFGLFCALLKWQPTVARLQLPLFVLGSAPIGVALSQALPAVVTRGLAAVLLVLAIPVATGNDIRFLSRDPVSGILKADRAHLYFGDRREVSADYLRAVDFAAKTGCRSIGLELSSAVGAQYEYPLLALLHAGAGTRVEAVDVTNASRDMTPPGRRFEPCLVICVRCERIGQLWTSYGGKGAAVTTFGDIVLFTPAVLSPR